MTLKVDIINGAYSLMRVSGLTKSPTDEDLELALERLEDMAEEFRGRNICTGYNFEDTPDPNSVHNVERKYWYAYKSNLAARLLADFGKQATPELIAGQRASYSFLSSDTAQVRSTQYPSRQPIGSGNNLRRYSWRQYYSPVEEAPISCATNKMIIDNVNDFVEHFDAYLNDGEVISSYTIEADTGLTIISSSNATPDINYRIRADGTSSEELNTLFQVKIVVTTDDSRVETRLINFELTEIEL
jgi:hypothetical protein